jgi:hypothetical protein
LEQWYIHDAARFAGQPGFPARAFVASPGSAAVFIFHNGPERKVFIDGRLEVATRRTIQDYEMILGAMYRADASWQSALVSEQGELPVVVLDTRLASRAILGMLQTPGWRLVYFDRIGAVFLPEATATRLGLPAIGS